MSTNIRMIFLAIAACAVSACAHVPRAPHPSIEQDKARAQFLAEHPSGKYNDEIQRGEIAKGMSAFEVFASWGVPDERRREKHHSKQESWFYVERDEYSGDYLVYEIVFHGAELHRWYMLRGTAASGGLFNSGASGYALFRESRAERQASSAPATNAPQK